VELAKVEVCKIEGVPVAVEALFSPKVKAALSVVISDQFQT